MTQHKTTRGKTLEELRARRGEILRVAAAHDAYNVRVFGSVARGEAQPDSDVDFLVDLDTQRRGFAYFGLLDDLRIALEELLDCRVDVGTDVQPHGRDTVLRDVVPL